VRKKYMLLRRRSTTISGALSQYISYSNISHPCSLSPHPVARHIDQMRARDSPTARKIIILQQFDGDTCIRQLVDDAKEPPCLILEHLESDALKSSGQATMSRQDVKFIARSVLSALASLHAKGIAHTGKMDRVHPAKQVWPGCRR
jgi:serine/threonine protein kinase